MQPSFYVRGGRGAPLRNTTSRTSHRTPEYATRENYKSNSTVTSRESNYNLDHIDLGNPYFRFPSHYVNFS